MSNRFEGKVIAIIGGSGGIGTAVSERIASEGGVAIVGDVRLEAAEETATAIAAQGGKAKPLAVDIGDEASIRAFFDAIVKEYGGIQGCHVNAVDTRLGKQDTDATDMDMAVYDELMRINQRGYFLCTKYAIPLLVANGGGCMLYTGSGAAYVGMADRPVYSMLKSATNALMRQVARRWGKQGVRSNVVSPGLIVHANVVTTKGNSYLEEALNGVCMPRLGKPSDIAGTAAMLLSDDGEYVTGQVLCVDGGHTMRA
ncbi:MAG TPA: SDR family oxidoreductase [Novosphingobium sp.]